VNADLFIKLLRRNYAIKLYINYEPGFWISMASSLRRTLHRSQHCSAGEWLSQFFKLPLMPLVVKMKWLRRNDDAIENYCWYQKNTGKKLAQSCTSL